MAGRKRKEKEPPSAANPELDEDEEEEGKEAEEVVDETEDIYDEKQMDEMLEDGEITAGEYGFMQGRDVSERKKKRIMVGDHEDTPSVELSEDDANESD